MTEWSFIRSFNNFSEYLLWRRHWTCSRGKGKAPSLTPPETRFQCRREKIKSKQADRRQRMLLRDLWKMILTRDMEGMGMLWWLLQASLRSWHFFKLTYLYSFIYLCGYAGTSPLHGLFSSCIEWGLLSSCSAQVSHCGGFSRCGARALELSGFSSCGTWPQ